MQTQWFDFATNPPPDKVPVLMFNLNNKSFHVGYAYYPPEYGEGREEAPPEPIFNGFGSCCEAEDVRWTHLPQPPEGV